MQSKLEIPTLPNFIYLTNFLIKCVIIIIEKMRMVGTRIEGVGADGAHHAVKCLYKSCDTFVNGNCLN